MGGQKNYDETDELLRQLYMNSAPRKEFKRQLEALITAEFNKNSRSFNFSNLLSLSRRISMNIISAPLGSLRLSVGFLLLSLLFFFSVPYVINYFSPTNQDGSSVVLAAERNAILKEIVKNNQIGILQTSLPVTPAPSFDTANESTRDSANYIISPEERGYTYSYTRTDTIIGPAYQKCRAYSYDDSSSNTQEYFSYYDDNRSITKNVLLDGTGTLLRSSFYQYDATTSQNLEYAGGSYAVKTITNNSTKPDTMVQTTNPTESDTIPMPSSEIAPVPSEAPRTTTDLKDVSTDQSELILILPEPLPANDPIQNTVDSLFGDDVTVEKIFDGGVLQSYLVTWRGEGDCALAYSSGISSRYGAEMLNTIPARNGEVHTIIRKTWYEADSMAVLRDEEYLDTITADTLIVSHQYYSENSSKAYTEVADIFTFSTDVEIKVIDNPYANNLYSAQDSASQLMFISKTTEYLKDNLLYPLFVNYTDISLTNLTRADEYNRLTHAREFFPANADGESRYKEAQTVVDYDLMLEFSSSQLSAPDSPEMHTIDQRSTIKSTSEYPGRVSVVMYKSDVPIDQILTSSYGITDSTNTSEEITINDNKITVPYYSLGETPLLLKSMDGSGSGSSGNSGEIQPSYPDIQEKSGLFILEEAGIKYFITVSANSDDFKEYTDFTLYNPSVDSDMDMIIDTIQSAF